MGKYERMEPIQFEMQMGCSKLFKTISYRLQGELVVRVPGKTPADYPPAQQSRKEIELEANLNRVMGDIADSIGDTLALQPCDPAGAPKQLSAFTLWSVLDLLH